MTKQDKIKLADMVLEFFQSIARSEDVPVLVGTLNKRQSYQGFKPAEVGHPVFEFKNFYFFYLESLDGKITNHKVDFYKESLAPIIDFTIKNNLYEQAGKNT